MPDAPFRRVPALLRRAVLGSLTALLCLQAAASLRWRIEHDAPLFHYAAFLMGERGRFPYRDFFETSVPGVFAFHYAVVKLFGYGDAAFRLVDLALLALLLGATCVFMSRFGRAAAWAAAAAFGLVYLSEGQTMTLQRDYLGLVPVACALACVPRAAAGGAGWAGLRRSAAAGALFGLAALLKPHLALGLPLVCGAVVAFRREAGGQGRRDLLKCAAVCLLSFLFPLLLAALWLYANSALGAFLWMFTNYLPLHAALTGAQEELSGPARAFYLFEQTLRFGGYGPALLAALAAGYHFAAQDGRGRETNISYAALAALAAAYLCYPALGGKFWDYHFMPTAYFLTLAAGLCFFRARPAPRGGDDGATLRGALPAVVFAAALCLQLNLPAYTAELFRTLRPAYVAVPPKAGRVDEMAAVLRARLRDGDTVQPLDWANGAVHAMLLARATLATRFLYDYHFYHHTSSPVVVRLRREFLAELREAAPRFILEVTADKPWFPAAGSPRAFPELYRFVETNYTVAARGQGFVLYERKGEVNPPPGANDDGGRVD
jgi:hypothetical protein